MVVATIVASTGVWGTQVGAATDPGATSEAPRLVTPVLSARRMPNLLRSHIADEKVRASLRPILDAAPANSCIVVSQGGRTVVDVRGDQAMAPASTEKLLTAVAALQVLGPDSRLETVAAAAKEPNNGVIDGDLYLIGGGDPLLTTEGYKVTFEDTSQAYNDFAQLADRLAAAGIREIRGGIVGDDSRYDTERWVSTWPQRYQRQDQVGPLSALTVNDGSTGLSDNPQVPAKVRKPGDPPSLAAATLATLLGQRGISVRGQARVGQAPPQHVEVARLDSLTIHQIVAEMLSGSDNTTAELLTKEIAYRRTGTGSTAAGTREIIAVAHDLGLPTDSVSLNDGSGLDPQNKVSCDLLDALLDYDAADGRLSELLPIAGETGTLRKRMRGTPAAGRVHAKTGTLNEVNALAGMAVTPGGAQLNFAYIINGPEPRAFAPLDEFAAALAAVPDGPPVAELAPRAPTG